MVEHRYYGPDTVIRARLASGELVAIRTPGYATRPPGDEIELAVSGDVLAYPRPPGDGV